MLFCRFCSICPLIDYFLKKNYSLRQNIFEKLEGLREVTHIGPNWCLFGSYWSWDLIGNKQHEGLWRFARKRVTERCTGLWSPASGQFIGGEPWCKGVTRRWNNVLPASGQKAIQRPVKQRRWRQDRSNSGYVRSVGINAFDRDSRGFGPLWNRPDVGWQRSVATTGVSGQ